jgi:DNA-binding LacI/PurR family transcriptional regulator
MARSLSTRESRIISMVIPNVGEYFTFNANPYFAELIAEVEKYVRARDYCLMIRCIDRCRDIVPLLLSWNVDGALFAGVSPEELAEVRKSIKCPAVFIDSYCEGEAACVGIDDYRGGYLSAQHLLNNGHRSIAFAAPRFGDRRTYQMDPANRREAVREVLADVAEGADYIIAKPAIAYLDIVRDIADAVKLPVVAYNVSGEYAMVKAAAANGWIDERRVVMENLLGMKRSGAKMIITYHALDAARWLKEDGL